MHVHMVGYHIKKRQKDATQDLAYYLTSKLQKKSDMHDHIKNLTSKLMIKFSHPFGVHLGKESLQ